MNIIVRMNITGVTFLLIYEYSPNTRRAIICKTISKRTKISNIAAIIL
jgi:hypothetical protein